MNIVIQIPIRPHLKKFVHWKENIPIGTPMVVSNRTAISIFLNSFITTKVTYRRRDVSLNRDKYCDTLRLLITSRHVERSYMCFTDDVIIRFNRFVNHLMHETLNDFIELRNFQDNKYINDAIHHFMSELDIYDDITFEALKKGNYRFRKNKDLPIFSSNGEATESLSFQ